MIFKPGFASTVSSLVLRKASSAWVSPKCEEGRLDVAHREVIASMSPSRFNEMLCMFTALRGIIAMFSAHEQPELNIQRVVYSQLKR